MRLRDVVEALVFAVSGTGHEDVAVIPSCCTDHVAQRSQGSWREVSVTQWNAQRNTHHIWGAVCTFVWSSDWVSYMGKNVASVSFPALTLIPTHTTSKVCCISRTALALSHPPLEMSKLSAVERKSWDFTAVSFWTFLCAHKVPALRGFKSYLSWRDFNNNMVDQGEAVDEKARMRQGMVERNFVAIHECRN